MSRIKGKDTQPEIILRKVLSKAGLKGYRLHYKLPGKPDIVFPKNRIAIFIDGCFWHKCPSCFIKPGTNKTFWKENIDSNVKRDKAVTTELKGRGWRVLRIWEHELRRENIIKRKILDKVKDGR
jgi:DNA mismatch endonuclease (patch repair protein)